MADTVLEWVHNTWTNIVCGLHDFSSPSIPANDISVPKPIPMDISHQTSGITPYNYHGSPIHHIEQFTTPIIHNKPEINTFNVDPQNHTMITHGIQINTVPVPSTHSNRNEYDLIVTQCDEASIKKRDVDLCFDDGPKLKLEVLSQAIEIEYIDDTFSDDYDEEIEINSDSSSSNTSDGVSDYIPTSPLTEESFYIQNVQNVIINDADYSKQTKMLYR
eukprot:UN01982